VRFRRLAPPVIATVDQYAVSQDDGGRPRTPCNGGIASTSASACCGSLRLAPCELDCERNATTVAEQMTFAAKFGPVGRIGTGLLTPKLLELNCAARWGGNIMV
jgi:hypothetical protein